MSNNLIFNFWVMSVSLFVSVCLSDQETIWSFLSSSYWRSQGSIDNTYSGNVIIIVCLWNVSLYVLWWLLGIFLSHYYYFNQYGKITRIFLTTQRWLYKTENHTIYLIWFITTPSIPPTIAHLWFDSNVISNI